MREYVELNTLKEDGRLYHNNLLDTIEALIPNQFDSVHAVGRSSRTIRRDPNRIPPSFRRRMERYG